MDNTQALGGTRHSTPLDNELSYPLTKDEFLTIKENLSIDKFSNWESLLLTSAVSAVISGIIFYMSSSLEDRLTENGIAFVKINWNRVIILIIYGIIAGSTIIGFIISRLSKKKTKRQIQRLDEKITNYFDKT